MTRTLFFLTALAAMLSALAAVLIRIELAYPDVSPLFQTSDGIPDGAKFGQVAVFHALISYLGVTLLGTTMASAAHTKGALFSKLFVWLGGLLSLGILALIALSYVPTPPDDATGFGWILHSSGTGDPETLFEKVAIQALSALTIDPSILDLDRVFFLPAAGMLLLGAYAMVGTLPSFRWLPALGVILVVPVTLLATSLLLRESLMHVPSLYLILALPLLACASIRLIDTAPSWLMILTVGLIIMIIGQTTLQILVFNTFSNGTMLEIAALYTFPLGIVFFALPALILYDRNHDLPAWGTALTIGVITPPLAQWVMQLAKLGLDGMPARYADFAAVFASGNLTVTVNVLIFTGLYLTVITAVRRAAR